MRWTRALWSTVLVGAALPAHADDVDLSKVFRTLEPDSHAFLLYDGTDLMGQATLTVSDGKGGTLVVELAVERLARLNSPTRSTWSRRTVIDKKGRLLELTRSHDGEGAQVKTETVTIDKDTMVLDATFPSAIGPEARSRLEAAGAAVAGDGMSAHLEKTVEGPIGSTDAVMAVVLADDREPGSWTGSLYEPVTRAISTETVTWNEVIRGEMEGMSGAGQRVDIGDEGRHVVFWNDQVYQVYLASGTLLMPSHGNDLEGAWSNLIDPRTGGIGAIEEFLAKKLAKRTGEDWQSLAGPVHALMAEATYKVQPSRIVAQCPETPTRDAAGKAAEMAGAIVEIKFEAEGWKVTAWRPPEGVKPAPTPAPEEPEETEAPAE